MIACTDLSSGSLKVFTDSDWAGYLETRKSTSGGIITIGEHCLKTWSTNQSSPALSSCEAEYYSVVDGVSRASGMQTAAKELGIEVGDLSVEIATDSSAGSPSRLGVDQAASVISRWWRMGGSA